MIEDGLRNLQTASGAWANLPGKNTMHFPSQVASRRPLVLAACLMATFMAASESTIVVTAMPSIVADLGGFSLYSWVFSAFLLTQAVSIPVYGRLADVFGRKRVFYVGSGLFLLGSALCGLAPSMPWLVVFRALQGLGAGGVQPMVMTICGDLYAPCERARVQGLISSVFGVAAVVAPSLGALLIEHGAWPVVFWVSLPLGAAAIAMISVCLREQVEARSCRIDYIGSLLLAVTIGMVLLLLLQDGSMPTEMAVTAGIFCIGTTTALFLHELQASEPMLPVELWRNRIIVVGSCSNGLASAVMMGIAAFLPTYVQGPMGNSPLAAGVVLGLMSLSWAFASFLSGRVIIHAGYRLTAILGAVSLIVGSLMLVALTPARGPSWAGAASLVIGAGMGLCNTAFLVSIQASVSWAQRGAATSSCLFARFIGQTLGAASFGAILNFTISQQMPNVAYASVDQLLKPSLRALLSATDQTQLSEFVVVGLHNGYWLAVMLSVATLLLVLLLPSRLSPAWQMAR